MPLPRRPQLDLEAARPRWLTAGMLRLLALSLFVVLVGMIRARMGPNGGWVVFGVGGALVALGAIAFAATTRREAARLPFGHLTEAFLVMLRRLGLPLLGLAFFLAWTLVYIALWAVHPTEAFTGLPKHPRFADFFYYAVSTAFISPPGDIIAHSRGTRSATMIEMLTAFALLTAYLSSFVDWYGRRNATEEQGSVQVGGQESE